MVEFRLLVSFSLRDQPIAPIYNYITLHLYDPQKVTGLKPNPWNHRRLEFVKVKRGESRE